MKNKSRLFFFCFMFIVLALTLYLHPKWGFMDDVHNVDNMQRFWSGEKSYTQMLAGDIHSWGRFRPVYYVWIITAYAISPPVLIYLLIALVGFMCLLLWGKIITHIFPTYKDDNFVRYVYPLVFFVFTPFWNNFMYISVQEKFIYFFGASGVYLLIKAYERKRLAYGFMALASIFVAMGAKETGLALLATVFVFACVDLVWFKMDRRISGWLAGISACTLVGYVYFIRAILGGYTAGYKEKMTIGSVIHAALSSAMMIKLIACFTLLALIVFIVIFITHRKIRVSPFFLLMPIFTLGYLAILLPWCFANYLLAPLGPFVGVMGFIFYILVSQVHPKAALLARSAVVVLALMMLMGVIIPRISKMADKRKIVEKLLVLNKQQPIPTFFYPPSMMETHETLKEVTHAQIIYTPQVNRQMLEQCQSACYLLMNDEAGSMQLNGVAVTRVQYQTGTWYIGKLDEQQGLQQTFQPIYQTDFISVMKQVLRGG